MFFHIIPQNSMKHYQITEEKANELVEIYHWGSGDCKIYCSEKKLDEIALIFQQRAGSLIEGLGHYENIIALDEKQEFIKDCTDDFFE